MTVLGARRLSQARPRGPGRLWWRPKARKSSFQPRDRTRSAKSGLGAQHRSRCGPRRAENGRAGTTNQRTPEERRAAARPTNAALEWKGRELRKLA